MTLLRRALGAAVVFIGAAACGTGPGQGSTDEVPGWFVDIAARSDLHFVRDSGVAGNYYLPEIKGCGGAFFDYDNDGDLDVFLVQGGPLKAGAKSILDLPDDLHPGDRLFRNDIEVGPDGLTRVSFVDTTEAAGIVESDYGFGVASGDYDNDGWVDIYVTGLTNNRLWRNRGDGTFADVTEETGTNDPRYSTSAAFLDYDADGWLDLYVANYIEFRVEGDKPCFSKQGRRDYCGPQSFPPVADRLFRNRGDGTFEDVSAKSGIAGEKGSGLGVVAADFNHDLLLDIYVANDNLPNFLWINQGDGRFVNQAMLAGCALSEDGLPESSMGVDAGDFDNDGDEDLFMTHLTGQTNTLYVNDGKGWFIDQSLLTGLGVQSQAFTAFGTAWVDVDNDGWLDLFIANGAVSSIAAQVDAGSIFPYRQRNQLFINRRGSFSVVGAEAGTAFEIEETSRGAAFGDVDNDGDIDILVTAIDGEARLLENRIGAMNHWLGVRLVIIDGVRDALGAWVTVSGSDGTTLHRRVRSAASFCSANDPRIVFGMGDQDQPVSVEVRWAGGDVERWSDLQVDRYHVIVEGEGES